MWGRTFLWLKIGDQCHLTGNNGFSDHNKCNINVNLKQNNNLPIAFLNFSIYDLFPFFKKFIEKNKEKVKFTHLPETNEGYISVTYGCIRFMDSYRFLARCLVDLVKTLDNDDFGVLKKKFPDKWEYLNEISISRKIFQYYGRLSKTSY